MRTNCSLQRFSWRAGAVLALAGCLWIPGESMALAQDTAQQQGATSDASLQSAVNNALANDPALKGEQVRADVSNGIVTLTGTVQTEQQRQDAETVAAGVQGVSGIQNNLNVTEPSSPAQTAPPAGTQTEQAPPPPDAQQTQQAPPPPPDTQQPAPPASAQQMPPPPPPDQTTPQMHYPQQYPAQPGYYPPQQGYNYPPQPVSGPVTIPGGTLLQIRTSQPLDLSKLKDGDAFQATVASDVFEGNVLAIPRGAVLTGEVVAVKKPGALGGNGELQLKITSLDLGGRQYPINTDIWTSKTPNKAGYTAGNTAGGALVGALIGGILGRGPGAAAGALVGGVGGMAASAASHSPGQYLPAETLLNFHISAPVTVQPVSWQEAQRLAQNAPRLQRRPVYMAAPYPYPYAYPYPYPYRAYYYGW